MKVLSFAEALRDCAKHSEKKGRPNLLLGNGFSIACEPSIFTYGSLFDRADFKSLSPTARAAFGALETKDFEKVMRALRETSELLDLYLPNRKDVRQQLLKDSAGLREVLVQAIAANHPEWPFAIASKKYTAARKFLAHFDWVYTLSYDLLLYWAVMHSDDGAPLHLDDGFRTPDGGKVDYVSWDASAVAQQRLFYLHGALHLFDEGPDLKKYTWAKTGIRLIEQVRAALKANLFPLIVSEGTSAQKMERIAHSGYLHRGYRSMLGIKGGLFVFGHSFHDSDEHVARVIRRNKVSALYVSLFGDPQGSENKQIRKRLDALVASAAQKTMQVSYFQAESAAAWG